MEAQLRQALLANAALVALVGGEGKARIFWDKIPDRTPVPAVLLQLIDTTHTHLMKKRETLTQNFVQADCLAGTKAEAIALRNAYLAALDGLKARPMLAFPTKHYGNWDTTGGPDGKGSTDLFREIVDANVWFYAA